VALNKAAAALDAAAHGMSNVKEVIIEMVCQQMRSPGTRMRALGLHGGPGCGKTTLATRGIAVALGRPAVVISLGGAHDSSVMMGHDFTYTSSRPGEIVRAIHTAGVMDPVFVFDELDKISNTVKGKDVESILMSLIDPSQNEAFKETYLAEIPLDLSRALFVFTFNDINCINPILLDRMNVLQVPNSSLSEKQQIVTKYMLPKIVKDYGMTNGSISDDALDILTSDKIAGGNGMRGIERALERAIMQANVRAIRAQEAHSSVKVTCRDFDGLSAASRSDNAYMNMYS
jgi:ATP-dependent Lon protease